MHPVEFSEYGMYISDIEDPVPLTIDVTGLVAKWATQILGEVWEDEYTGYRYEKGDENVVEVFMIVDGDTYEDEYDLYLDEEDGEQGY